MFLEGLGLILPAVAFPDWIYPVAVALVVIGFPVTMILAWFFDLTSEGLRLTEDGENAAPSEVLIGALLFLFLLTGGGWWVLSVGSGPTEASDVVAVTSVRDLGPRSVAVLPFEPMTPDSLTQIFGDGLQAEVASKLAGVAALTVASRGATERFRDSTFSTDELARELGVAGLVEGTVQRVGERLRLNVSLVAAAGGATLWSQVYDARATIDELLGVQSDLSRQIAAALQATLTEDEITQLEETSDRQSGRL